MVSFEEFQKLDLRIGRIVTADRVEGSVKLLKLSLDLGGETREIVAGIGTVYAPEELVGREIVIVANLEPRALMGIESQGMLLAADGGAPVLLVPERDVPPGAKVS